MTEDVLRVKVRVLERDGGDEVDETRKVRRIDLELGVVLVEDVLEFDSRPRANPAGSPGGKSMSLRSIHVLLLDGLQRVVDELVGGGDLVRVGETPTLLEDFRLGRELGGVSSAARTLCGMAWHFAGAHS